MKRVFDMQKGLHEVTITLDYEDYLELIATIEAIATDPTTKDNYYVRGLKRVKDLIESIDPKYIWDED